MPVSQETLIKMLKPYKHARNIGRAHVKKKELITLVQLLMLLAVPFVTENRANANPNLVVFPSAPVKSLPTITINMPVEDGSYPKDKVTLDFNVTKPDSSWFWGGYGVPPCNAIASISYTVDGSFKPVSVFFNLKKAVVDGLEETSHYAFELVNLTEGKHDVQVDVEVLHFYGGKTSAPLSMQDNTHVSVIFNVDYNPPTISNLSVENKTYSATTLPLSFEVEAPEWVAYSLDGQDHVTVGGNVTIEGLHDGAHSIVVYANNTAGTICESETVFFTVDASIPEDFFPTIVLSVIIVLVFATSLLVYFMRRKKKRRS
jgi:hypothetical protein